MLNKIQIKRILKAVLLLGFFIVSLSFVEEKRQEKVCRNVEVEILDEEENYFLTKEEILDLASARNQEHIRGGKLIHINQSAIEKRLKNNKFVKNVQVVEDHAGNVVIHVEQNRPVARVFRKGMSFYIGSSGEILPLSNVYTARVPVVFCENDCFSETMDTLVQRREKEFVKMLLMLGQDKFLNAQVAEITFKKNNEVELHTQISKQPVLIGDCLQLVDKFENLHLIYKDILPRKGWNTYEKISLKYKDQIICK